MFIYKFYIKVDVPLYILMIFADILILRGLIVIDGKAIKKIFWILYE